MCTCFCSIFCVTFRGVVLCGPLRSLSSKVARARVTLDPGGMFVRPVTRFTASYKNTYKGNTVET